MFPERRGTLMGVVATVLFYIPVVREMFLWGGYIDARRAVLERALRDGKSVFLLPGGEAESLLCERGTDRVVAGGEGRKGFVRLALDTGALLVPVYTFFNTDTYAADPALFAGLRRWVSRRWQVCLPLFVGRWGTPVPFNVRLTVAVGDPVPLPLAHGRVPRDADGRVPPDVVDAYHRAYLEALVALFHKHKAGAGYPPGRRLEVWGAPPGRRGDRECCLFVEGGGGELVDVTHEVRRAA